MGIMGETHPLIAVDGIAVHHHLDFETDQTMQI
jgi:hypothetical protein